EERDQDDRNAVVAQRDLGPRDLGCRRLSRGAVEAGLAVLCAVAGGGLVQAGQRPAISRTTFHSSSVTGATDSRDWRMSSILASLRSALISASVTGRGGGRTGSTRTRTQAGALGSGSAPRVTRMIPTTALSDMLW